MAEHDQVEEQIQRLLASNADAISLNNKLFGAGGLFGQLADTEATRRVVAQSALFKRALHRLSELQRNEAAQFARVVHDVQAVMPEKSYLVKLEHTAN